MTKNSSSVLSRRGFIKRAALAGAGPLILPSWIFAAKTPPNSQIAVASIGLGIQGRGLMGNCLWRDQARVVAVCDVDTTRRNSAQQMVNDHYAEAKRKGTYKGCDAYNDFRQVVARKDIDAVIIATPDHWHAMTSIAAAKSGKDIYCEKPMSHSVLEGQAMVKAARRHGRVFQVGSMQRSMGEFRAACELVRNGVLGKIQSVEVCVGGPPVPCDLPAEKPEPGLDWNMWVGPSPYRPYNSILSPRGVYTTFFPDWRKYREYGSGQVGDWGAHHFDIVQWALGYDDSGPVEFLPVGDPNAVSGVRFRYANGVEVKHLPGNGITFYGSAGKIYVNRGEFKFWLGDQLLTSDVKESRQMTDDHLPANAVRLYQSGDHMGNWIACMKTRQLPICDVEIGHRTASICELVNATYRYRQRLLWNPARESFINGTGNSKWLGLEYRGSWRLS